MYIHGTSGVQSYAIDICNAMDILRWTAPIDIKQARSEQLLAKATILLIISFSSGCFETGSEGER